MLFVKITQIKLLMAIQTLQNVTSSSFIFFDLELGSLLEMTVYKTDIYRATGIIHTRWERRSL